MFRFCDITGRQRSGRGPRFASLLRQTVLVPCGLLAVGTANTEERDALAGMSRAQIYRRVEGVMALGRRMFVDPSLSASGRI